MDGVFKMWSHQCTIERYEDLISQPCEWRFMKYSIPFALLAADVKFTVMLRPLICSHFCSDLPLASRIKLDEDRECLILKDNGFYLHSTEDPIDETH